jgi:hypothetical protein
VAWRGVAWPGGQAARTPAAKNRLSLVPEKFNTFNIFAIFHPALEHPTLIHRQAPRTQSVWNRATNT